MKNFLKSLEGYKTYIATAILVILAGLRATDMLDNQTVEILAYVAQALIGYGIYDKIKRNSKK